MAQVVPELIYRSVIMEGLAWIKSNLGRIDHFLSGFDSETIRNFREYIQTHDIEVIQGWPRSNTPLPCIAIVLLQENDEQFIGDDLGVNTETDPNGVILGSFWGGTHVLVVASDNADLTVFLYYVLKIILKRSSTTLNEFLHEISYDAGDLQPNLNYLPDHVVTRGISISARYFDAVQIDFDPVDILRVVLNIREDSTAPFTESPGDPVVASATSEMGMTIVSCLTAYTPKTVKLSGVASSSRYAIASVTYTSTVNSAPHVSGTASGTDSWALEFTVPIDLAVYIEVTATDIVGNSITKDITVILSSEGKQ